jgi:Holliday junction resolvase-like predicted endonuclease
MFAGRLTQATLRVLDWVSARILSPEDIPAHLSTGRRGEEDAYFYLRRRGYTIIARNYRSPNHRGELDIVGWERDVLCFIEVKTRTARDMKPAEAAVDRGKQRDLSLVALRLSTSDAVYMPVAVRRACRILRERRRRWWTRLNLI